MHLSEVERVVVRTDDLAVRALCDAVPLRVGNLRIDEPLVVVVARDVEDGRRIGFHHVEVLAQREVVLVPHDVGGHVAQMERIDRTFGALDFTRDVGQVPFAELRQVEFFGVAPKMGVGRDEEREVVVAAFFELEIDHVEVAMGRVTEKARDQTVGGRFVASGDGHEHISAGFRGGHFVTSVGIGPDDQFTVRDDDSGDGFPFAGDPAHDVGLLCLRAPGGAECG